MTKLLRPFMKYQAPSHGRARIVSVLSSFPSDSPFLLGKFLELVERGLDMHLVCLTSGNTASYKSLEASVKSRVKLAWPTGSRWLAAILLPFVLARCLLKNCSGTLRYLLRGASRFGLATLGQLYLDAEMICLRPNLLHFEFGTLARDRMYLRELLGARVVVSFRGYDLNFVGLDKPDYYNEVWDWADALHLLGEDLWRRAQERGCPGDKQHVLIPPAIDTDFFTPTRIHPSASVETDVRPLRLLSVGRLVWKKGYEYGLEAVRLLLDEGVDCEYHIVGDGEYSEAVAFARHQLGLTEEVSFTGRLGPYEVRAQMEWADIFLHPAVSEGFCNAVLEAQSMMLPVVCSDADGLAENVADRETGFVVGRRSPKALADRMTLLARDASLRERMGAAGRKRVLERFQLADQISAFEKLYRELLFPSGAPKLVVDQIRTAHAS